MPAKLEVHVHVRPKYACRYCKDGVVSPPPPERPIARGIAGPGLIAQIVVSKFGDHLPLYRQEDFFARHGLHIARSTQCDWVQAAAELLRPLHDRQKELVLKSPVLWTDDIPITVLTGDEEGSRQGRLWTYIGEEYPYSVYDFTENRARDGPAQFLAGFQGYLHADAYGGYDHIYLGSNDSIREVGHTNRHASKHPSRRRHAKSFDFALGIAVGGLSARMPSTLPWMAPENSASSAITVEPSTLIGTGNVRNLGGGGRLLRISGNTVAFWANYSGGQGIFVGSGGPNGHDREKLVTHTAVRVRLQGFNSDLDISSGTVICRRLQWRPGSITGSGDQRQRS